MSAYHQDGNAPLNGTARDLEIYLKDTTLRVTLFGWALQIPRAEVQQVASQFYETGQHDARGMPEWPGSTRSTRRWRSAARPIDRVDALPAGASPPALAATHSVAPDDPTLDTVIWLNLGTITGTPGANEFYTELESLDPEHVGHAAAEPLATGMVEGVGLHGGRPVDEHRHDPGDPRFVQPGRGRAAHVRRCRGDAGPLRRRQPVHQPPAPHPVLDLRRRGRRGARLTPPRRPGMWDREPGERSGRPRSRVADHAPPAAAARCLRLFPNRR